MARFTRIKQNSHDTISHYHLYHQHQMKYMTKKIIKDLTDNLIIILQQQQIIWNNIKKTKKTAIKLV